jgi:hypothetical protein
MIDAASQLPKPRLVLKVDGRRFRSHFGRCIAAQTEGSFRIDALTGLRAAILVGESFEEVELFEFRKGGRSYGACEARSRISSAS